MIEKYGSREEALKVAQDRLSKASMGDLRYWDKITKDLTNPQTHNYVVFDDKLIDIVKKYGLAGLIAGGAYHAQLPAKPSARASNGRSNRNGA